MRENKEKTDEGEIKTNRAWRAGVIEKEKGGEEQRGEKKRWRKDKRPNIRFCATKQWCMGGLHYRYSY